MKNKALQKSFDYSAVDKDTKSDLIYFANQILKARDTAAKSVIEMGQFLAMAQDRLADYSGGVFVGWLEGECGFAKSTAYRLINTYRVFGSFPNLGKLEDSALYALSENTAPEKARKEAMKLAEKGESITHAKAKEIIAKYKEPRSETGKPGGAFLPSSERPQVVDVPVSSQPAAETEPDVEEVYTEETPEETTEPASDPEQEFRTQKSKTIKTIEAAMRAFDDMNRFKKGCLSPQGAESLSTALITVAEKVDVDTLHDTSISLCKLLLQSARNW